MTLDEFAAAIEGAADMHALGQLIQSTEGLDTLNNAVNKLRNDLNVLSDTVRSIPAAAAKDEQQPTESTEVAEVASRQFQDWM